MTPRSLGVDSFDAIAVTMGVNMLCAAESRVIAMIVVIGVVATAIVSKPMIIATTVNSTTFISPTRFASGPMTVN